ncbi:glycosyltransferase family 8 protein [Phanerochaete sordida]|uniref:Glycosyltransferase family 8 protein n=1 Tax=Phanerochaete sordida TaxID=48140 RepID=A0A9P3G9E9_9APHY|nr:glycosyltransferase family 8 protein [Phanerochaete sordida]
MRFWAPFARKPGYMRLPAGPLYDAGSPAPYKSLYKTACVALVVLVLSIALNCYLLFSNHERWPAAFEDFQQLKDYPLLNRSLVPTSIYHPNETAFVTTLYSDSYAPAVAALGHSLRKTNTPARLLVLYFPDTVSQKALCVATASGFVPQPVARIAPPDDGRGMNPHFADQYTKLALWTLDALPAPVRAAVYLDADTLALGALDELFAQPYALAAAPDVYFSTDVNAGVLALHPDTALHAAMRGALALARFPREYAEQAFLNSFFAADMLRLPLAYNGNIALKKRAPRVWAALRAQMRVIHYTDTKPFISHSWKEVPLDRLHERVRAAGRENGGIFKEEMDYWEVVWRDTLATYSDHLSQC